MPRERTSSSSPRTIRRPPGSSALVGSSSSRSLGDPISACAIPRRCCIPFDIVSTRWARASPSPTSSSRSPRSAVPPAEPVSFWCSSSSSSAVSQPGKPEELGEVAGAGARLEAARGRAHRPRRSPRSARRARRRSWSASSCRPRWGRAARRAALRRPRGRRRPARPSPRIACAGRRSRARAPSPRSLRTRASSAGSKAHASSLGNSGGIRSVRAPPPREPKSASPAPSSPSAASSVSAELGMYAVRSSVTHPQALGQVVEDPVEVGARALVLGQLPRLRLLDVAVEPPDRAPDLLERPA